MSELDRPDFQTVSGQNAPQKLTAADFEIYAPRALAIADMHGEGIATKAEIQHMVAAPAPGEDAITKQSMQFLLDHYELLQKLSSPVEVEYGKTKETIMVNGIPTSEDKKLFQIKYGITPYAVERMNNVLEGKQAPSPDQFNGDLGPSLIVGSVITSPFVGLALGETFVSGMVLAGAATLGAGVALGAAVGFGIYKYEQMQDKKTWRDSTRDQYSAFLQDLEGAEKIKQQLPGPNL